MSNSTSIRKPKVAKAPLAHQDLAPYQESWAAIPNWPAKWKASVEPTPAYFPKGSPKFIATAHGANFSDQVQGFGSTPAAALIDACKNALSTGKIRLYRGKPLGVPLAADFATVIAKSVAARKDPLIALPNGWQRKAGTYHRDNAAGRNKDVLYPDATATIFIPYWDNVDVDYDPGTPGNYDSYEKRTHSITLGPARVTKDPNMPLIAKDAYSQVLGNTSDWEADKASLNTGAQLEINFYSKVGIAPSAGDTAYLLKREFDAPDYYEGDYALVEIIAAFDNRADALAAASYEAMGPRLRYTEYSGREITIESAILV